MTHVFNQWFPPPGSESSLCVYKQRNSARAVRIDKLVRSRQETITELQLSLNSQTESLHFCLCVDLTKQITT